MNVNSIRPDLNAARAKRFRRIERVLSVIDEETGNIPFMAMLQETWLEPDFIGKYAEEGMPLLSSISSTNYPCLVSNNGDPSGQTKGRGLMIIVHPHILTLISSKQGQQVTLQRVEHIHAQSFELLAGFIGPIFLVSVYVKITSSGPPDPEHIANIIQGLKPPHCSSIIVGGDFNYHKHWGEMRDIFEGQLDLVSTVDGEESITSTHRKGNVLDHILVPRQAVINKVQAIEWEFSDHSIIRVDVDIDINSRSSMTNNRSVYPSERLNISKFRKVRAEVSRKKPPPKPEQVELNEGFMREVEMMLETIEKEEDIDLHKLNSMLLDVALDSYGSSKSRPRIQKAFMYDRKVREVASKRKQSRKKYNRVAGKKKIEAKEELVEANRRWEKTRRTAQRQQEDDLARAIVRGDVSIFWALFRKTRTARPADSCNAKLSPDDAAQFYRSLFSDPETAKLIRETIPSGEQSESVIVSEEEVREALRQTKDCASGPDGVHPILLRHCAEQLAPILARLYTKCLREGIPKALRRGSITLIAKTHPPSSDPALYRPITLLPSIIRVMMRVIDNKLRKLIADGRIEVPIEQGGFLKDRSTTLQSFSLMLVRDWARGEGRAVYVAFLDIEKAFDSFNHEEMLEVFRQVGVPPEIVDAIHRLLPYFELEIFGRIIDQEKGTFQGSPLSPLLCVLFLIDFISDINNNQEGFEGVKIPVDIRKMIRTLLFADDIVLIASSIDQLRIALKLAGRWGGKRRVRFGHKKCKVMRLAREPSDRTTREELEAVELQGHTLEWVHEYNHLGHRIVEAAEYRKQQEIRVPIDEKKLTGLCFAMARAFPSTARCCRVAPLAIRLGVRQVIHAKYLYPTAIMETDYKLMDVKIRSSLRYILGMPHDSASAQLHADLGIWPSEYYAHRRAMKLAYRVAHRYWTRSERAMTTLSDGTEGRSLSRVWPEFLRVRKVHKSVIAELEKVMSIYKLTWEVVYGYQGDEHEWGKLISKRLYERFAVFCEQAAEKYDHPILADPMPREDKPRIKAALSHGGELALAALRMRCPSLRMRPDREAGKCRYCKKGRENGRHLLQCMDIPPDLLEARKIILDDIRQQGGGVKNSHLHISDIALRFEWDDIDDSLLKKLLVWCRNMINRYASYIPHWEIEQLPELQAYPVYRVRPRCR